MKRCSRILLLVSAVVILMAIVAADEPTASGKDTTLAAETPMMEMEGTAVSENVPVEATTQEMNLISMAAAKQSETDISSPEESTNGGSSAISDSANTDPFNRDTLMNNALNGPVDVPAESMESHESVDEDMDSEESLTPSVRK